MSKRLLFVLFSGILILGTGSTALSFFITIPHDKSFSDSFKNDFPAETFETEPTEERETVQIFEIGTTDETEVGETENFVIPSEEEESPVFPLTGKAPSDDTPPVGLESVVLSSSLDFPRDDGLYYFDGSRDTGRGFADYPSDFTEQPQVFEEIVLPDDQILDFFNPLMNKGILRLPPAEDLRKVIENYKP